LLLILFITQITFDGVYWNIKQLKSKGLIERVGPDKGGYWQLINKDV